MSSRRKMTVVPSEERAVEAETPKAMPTPLPEPPQVPEPPQEEVTSDRNVSFLFKGGDFHGADLVYTMQAAFLCGLNLLIVVNKNVSGATLDACINFFNKVYDRANNGYTVKRKGKTTLVPPLLARYEKLGVHTTFDFVHMGEPIEMVPGSYLCDVLFEPKSNIFDQIEGQSQKKAYQGLHNAIDNQFAWGRYNEAYEVVEAYLDEEAFEHLKSLVKERDLSSDEVRTLTRITLALSEINGVNPVNKSCVDAAFEQFSYHKDAVQEVMEAIIVEEEPINTDELDEFLPEEEEETTNGTVTAEMTTTEEVEVEEVEEEEEEEKPKKQKKGRPTKKS